MKQCIYRSGGKSLLTAESPKNPQKKYRTPNLKSLNAVYHLAFMQWMILFNTK